MATNEALRVTLDNAFGANGSADDDIFPDPYTSNNFTYDQQVIDASITGNWIDDGVLSYGPTNAQWAGTLAEVAFDGYWDLYNTGTLRAYGANVIQDGEFVAEVDTQFFYDIDIFEFLNNPLSVYDAKGVVLTGNKFENWLQGGRKADDLIGKGGDDTLRGGSGGDHVIGGNGADHLYGQGGSDTFVFAKSSESKVGAEFRDVIEDYNRIDTIDVSEIDANKLVSDNQEFDFIGHDRFSDTAGELRYSSRGILAGDTNGDGRSDFQIEVTDAPSLTADDFIL